MPGGGDLYYQWDKKGGTWLSRDTTTEEKYMTRNKIFQVKTLQRLQYNSKAQARHHAKAEKVSGKKSKGTTKRRDGRGGELPKRGRVGGSRFVLQTRFSKP